MTRVLPADFYAAEVSEVAERLIGCRLCRRSRTGFASGIIVETEAYLPHNDSASHAARGLNRRNAAMFGPAGRAYVYTIHARQCFNVVTGARGVGAAVLVRALQPEAGIQHMVRRRDTPRPGDLCRGPARLCEALDIGRDLNHWPLTGGTRLWIEERTTAAAATSVHSPSCLPTARSVRIGVTSATDLPLRFFAAGSQFVSGPRWLNHRPGRQPRDPG